MRTPEHYKQMLKQRCIPEEIFAEIIFSVNRKAKNCRDRKREHYYQAKRYNYYFHFMAVKHYKEREHEYYDMKNAFLAKIEPKEIHVKKRISNKKKNTCLNSQTKEINQENSCFDCGLGTPQHCVYRNKIDDKEIIKEFFLFYNVDGYNFHVPISKINVKTLYPQLNIVEIGYFRNSGKIARYLLSPQFCKKVYKSLDKIDIITENQERIIKPA